MRNRGAEREEEEKGEAEGLEDKERMEKGWRGEGREGGKEEGSIYNMTRSHI